MAGYRSEAVWGKPVTAQRLLAVLLAAAVLLFAAACSGDGTPAGTPLPSGRTPAPAAKKGAPEASRLAAKFLAGVDGKYEYLYTAPIGNSTEGTLTIYRLGVNDRQDWKASPYGIEATTVTILGAENNYLCTLAEGFDTCRIAGVPEVESIRITSSPIYNALIAMVVEPDKLKFEDLPEETYAGLAGKCYKATSEERLDEGAPSREEIKACFRDDGAILYFQRAVTPDSTAIEPATYTIELQAAGEAVPGDFEPPARVQ